MLGQSSATRMKEVFRFGVHSLSKHNLYDLVLLIGLKVPLIADTILLLQKLTNSIHITEHK
jgi:hypothetical protein